MSRLLSKKAPVLGGIQMRLKLPWLLPEVGCRQAEAMTFAALAVGAGKLVFPCRALSSPLLSNTRKNRVIESVRRTRINRSLVDDPVVPGIPRR